MSDVKIVFSAETNAAGAAVQKFASDLRTKLEGIAATVAAAFSVHAFADWIRSNAEASDETGKTAQKIGLTIEEFSKLSNVMRQGNIDLGKFTMVSREFLNWMKENGQAGKNFTEVLIEQADVIAQMHNPAARAAAAAERFGRLNGLDLIPILSEGSAKLRERIAEMEWLGVTTEREAEVSGAYNDALSNLHTSTGSLSRTLATSFMPALTDVVKAITDVVAGFNKFTQESPAALKAIQALTIALASMAAAAVAASLASFVAAFPPLAAALALAGTAALAFGAAVGGWKLGEAIGEVDLLGIKIKDRLESSILATVLAWEKLKSAFGADNADVIQGLEEDIAKLVYKTAQLNEARKSSASSTDGRLSKDEMEKERALIDERIKANQLQEEAFKIQLEKRGGIPTEEDIALLREYNKTEQELINQRGDLLFKTNITTKEALPYADKDFEALNEARRKALAIKDPNSFTEQLSGAFDELVRKAGTTAQLVGSTFTSMVDGITGAFAQGLQGMFDGTLTFSQGLQKIWQGLGQAVAQTLSQMVADFLIKHLFMEGISYAFKAVKSAIWAEETAEHGVHQATQVATHTAGETAKTGSTLIGSLGRGILRLGETVFHAAQVALRVGAHVAGELFMTAVSLGQVLIRSAAILAETIKWLVMAAIKGADAVADVPYVGPYLAIAALAAIMAAGGAAIAGAFAEGGLVRGPGTGTSDSVVARVSKGEYIVNAAAVEHYGVGYLESLNSRRAAIGDALRTRMALRERPITSSAERMQSEAPGLNGGGSAQINVAPTPPAPVYFAVLKDQNEVRQFMESNAGKQIVQMHVRNSKDALGFPT